MSGKVIAVVPAAGSGVRFGPGANKTLALLLGKPVLIWTLGALDSSAEVSEIIPVLRPEDMEECLRLVEEHGIRKVKRIAPGGAERQDSVMSGLGQIEDRDCVVLIHDGARPLIDEDIIRRVLRGLEGFDGAVCAIPPNDTIKRIGGDGAVDSTPPRESLVAVQTPQAFPCESIIGAYGKARAGGFRATDDATLVERAGGRVNVVEGSYRNIKITTPEDLEVAEMFLRKR